MLLNRATSVVAGNSCVVVATASALLLLLVIIIVSRRTGQYAYDSSDTARADDEGLAPPPSAAGDSTWSAALTETAADATVPRARPTQAPAACVRPKPVRAAPNLQQLSHSRHGR